MKTLFLFFVGILVIWFFYAERAILTPFILGAIFAYIFNPVVNLLSQKTKISRGISANIVYLLLMTIVVVVSTLITRRIINEFDDIRNYVNYLLLTARAEINTLPDWIRPSVYDFLFTIQKSKVVGAASLLPFFPQAISRLVSFIIFLVSGYYFLREGNGFFESIIRWIPKHYKVDVEILLRKINAILGSYLRGQIFLVFLMSLVTFVSLSVLGVRFALFLGIFSGFAEIVPLIGPVTAATIAVLVVLVTGTVNFGLGPINGALIVILLYFVFRHIEDYFVIPHIMGKITKLPPFVIFFAVIAGGHLAGVLGLILAVPVAAIINILLEFSLDQINGGK